MAADFHARPKRRAAEPRRASALAAAGRRILLLVVAASPFLPSARPLPAAAAAAAGILGGGRSRFRASGPVLTVTLRDPFGPDSQSSSSSSQSSQSSASSPSSDSGPSSRGGLSGDFISNLSGLSPTLLWSVRSTSAPFPTYLPSLSSAALAVGYKYDDLRRLPSFLDGNARFGFPRLKSEVRVNPSYEVRRGRASAVVRAGGEGGGWYVLGRVAAAGRGSKKFLEVARASYRRSLPFASVGSFSVTPTHDFVRGESSCVASADSGTGRTTAVLDLNWDDPTLTVVHALDERNTISPEISLYTAKITYDWTLNLDSGSVRTRVDPTSAVQVTWTDRSMNGKWVTDVKLPLEAGSASPLKADIRVRRQFTF